MMGKKKEEKKEKKKEEKDKRKIPRWLRILLENSHRWAGIIAGPPGSGKTTFMRMIAKHTDVILVSVKENHLSQEKIMIPEEVVVKKISAVLHFTVIGIRPAFDALNVGVSKIEEIENVLGRFRSDVAEWVRVRLEVLRRFLVESNNRRYFEIPLFLQNADELEKRIIIGVLYVARHLIPKPVLLDDALAFITNERYSEAFYAMMRPYIISVNRYLDSRELLHYNPIIITPGGAGVSVAPRHGPHRLARRDKYVILFDGHRFEVPRDEVQKLAQTQ